MKLTLHCLVFVLIHKLVLVYLKHLGGNICYRFFSNGGFLNNCSLSKGLKEQQVNMQFG